MNSAPLLPDIDEPDPISSEPLLPSVAFPELRITTPLTPERPASEELRTNDPLENSLLTPVDTNTDPPEVPEVVEVKPAERIS